jgi:hypothetical protein
MRSFEVMVIASLLGLNQANARYEGQKGQKGDTHNKKGTPTKRWGRWHLGLPPKLLKVAL